MTEKDLDKARRHLLLKKYLSSKILIALTVFGIMILVVSLILISWAIQGQNIGVILSSPLMMLWYFILVVVVIVLIFIARAGARKKG